jgi:release factor glutamine methyltransferase
VLAPTAPTRQELVVELTAALGGARHEARFIVDEALRDGGAESGAWSEPVGADAAEAARDMAARRLAGEPLQHVFGHWSFRSLDLLLSPQVLIPRPETEQVVEVALAEAERTAPGVPVVVDAGTGSGAIALAMATELPGPSVWATDTSPDALAVAALNLERVRKDHPGVAVTFVEGNWLEPLPRALRGQIDVVVANPPYVSENEWNDLDAEVRREPRRALVAGPASDGTPGLAAVEEVLAQARGHLAGSGVVVVELSPDQANAAVRLARGLGYGPVRVEPDLAGRSRALVARAG